MLPQDVDRPVAESLPLKPVNYNSIGERTKTFVMWLLISLVLHIAHIVMLFQTLFGSGARARMQAVAYDEVGNTIFGGPPDQTMSSRVGNAKIRGQKWAKIAAPVLDFFFGKGHPLSNVNLPADQLSDSDKAAVNAADAQQGVRPLLSDPTVTA